MKNTYPTVAIMLGVLLGGAPLWAEASPDTSQTTGLPKVLIIGDSISSGYTMFVAGRLDGVARVERIPGNGQHTHTGLERIDAWLGDTEWDVIHFNWGLWDLCRRHPDSKVQGNRDKVNGTLTTPLEQYGENLDRLVGRLKQTGARLVFANTTAVPEGEAGRIVGDDKKYNAVAARVMEKHGVRINDLNALTSGFPPELFVRPGDVHYTRQGYQRIGRQVADGILAALRGGEPSVPRSRWFQDARFGLFIHWGLYSELAGTWNGRTLPDKSLANGDSWYSEWAQMRLDIPREDYQALAKTFHPTGFDAGEWARETELAGMKYLVITAKHHDGFALWDSAVSDYDMGATPFKRDLLGELVTACRARGIKVGFYYSHWQDWEHPGGALPPWPDKEQPGAEAFDRYWEEKCLPQVAELLDRYDPDLLWFDTWADKSRDQITAGKRDQLIDLIRRGSGKCLINGRICSHDPGPRIDYLSAGDNQHPERNLGRPWQTPATMNHTWAWHANDFQWKPTERMIRLLVTNASLGGNYLLNIGPYADGGIPRPSIRRMREIGGWLTSHAESIYGTRSLDDVPVPEWGRLTTRTGENGERIVYAHVMDWSGEALELPAALGRASSATVLETGQPVTLSDDGTRFSKPDGGVHPAVATIRLTMQ